MEYVLSTLKVKRSITVNVFGNIDLFYLLRSKKMMKLAKELTTANSLVNGSESEDEAVLFVIVTPVMLAKDLYQKYNR